MSPCESGCVGKPECASAPRDGRAGIDGATFAQCSHPHWRAVVPAGPWRILGGAMVSDSADEVVSQRGGECVRCRGGLRTCWSKLPVGRLWNACRERGRVACGVWCQKRLGGQHRVAAQDRVAARGPQLDFGRKSEGSKEWRQSGARTSCGWSEWRRRSVRRLTDRWRGGQCGAGERAALVGLQPVSRPDVDRLKPRKFSATAASAPPSAPARWPQQPQPRFQSSRSVRTRERNASLALAGLASPQC